MKELTHRQRLCLEYIRSSITDRGYPPTLREIGAAMRIGSTNGVNDHLRALERKGYIDRDDVRARGMRVLVMPPPLNEPAFGASPRLAELRKQREDIVRKLAALDRVIEAEANLLGVETSPATETRQ